MNKIFDAVIDVAETLSQGLTDTQKGDLFRQLSSEFMTKCYAAYPQTIEYIKDDQEGAENANDA